MSQFRIGVHGNFNQISSKLKTIRRYQICKISMSSTVTKKISYSTSILTSIWKYHQFPISYKFPHNPNRTSRLHTIIWAKENKLIKLCAKNYATFDNFIIEQIESSNSQHNL
jgi:hypothetical protein